MDSQVFDLILQEHNRQITGLELIASKNYVSDDVLRAGGSILTNKYAEGYEIITGGTDNHLRLISLEKKSGSGKQVEDILGRANITVNKNMISFDKRTATMTSGIRIGTAVITTRGLLPTDMNNIVQWIDQAIKKPAIHLHGFDTIQIPTALLL